MNATNSAVISARFSTEDFSEHERTTAWREFFGREIVKLDIEPLEDRPYSSVATARILPDLVLTSGNCSGAHYRMTHELISSDDIAFITSASDNWTASQFGRESVLGKDDAVLMMNGEPGSMINAKLGAATHPMRFISLAIPRRAIAPLVSNVEDVAIRRIPADSTALRLLKGYLHLLEDPTEVASPEVARFAALHVHDLLALAMGATRDAAELAHGRGVRAARLRAIKRDIVDSLGKREVGAMALAKRHGVTPRYVHRLFEAEGVTLSQFVLGQRLARAHRMLGDPRYVGHTISAIAFEIGFGDLSTFNRDFRRRFGMTPSDVRAAACTAN